jgi:hypothetical protein
MAGPNTDIAGPQERELLRATLRKVQQPAGRDAVLFTSTRAVPGYELHTDWARWCADIQARPPTLSELRAFKQLVARLTTRSFWFDAPDSGPREEAGPVLEVYELSTDPGGNARIGLRVLLSGYLPAWLDDGGAG